MHHSHQSSPRHMQRVPKICNFFPQILSVDLLISSDLSLGVPNITEHILHTWPLFRLRLDLVAPSVLCRIDLHNFVVSAGISLTFFEMYLLGGFVTVETNLPGSDFPGSNLLVGDCFFFACRFGYFSSFTGWAISFLVSF